MNILERTVVDLASDPGALGFSRVQGPLSSSRLFLHSHPLSSCEREPDGSPTEDDEPTSDQGRQPDGEALIELDPETLTLEVNSEFATGHGSVR